MHRVAELLRQRRVRVVAAEVGVVRLVAVGAPVALELTGLGVHHHHALVAVAVGHVQLVILLVDEDLRHLEEVVGGVAVRLDALLAELLDELAVARELQHQSVGAAVAANPDEPFAVGEDAVVAVGPVVALAGSAKRMDDVAGLVELDDRRRLLAAFAGRRGLVGGSLVGVGRIVAVDDPDVILGVGPHTDGLADIPAVRQWLRPHRIDLEPRRGDAAAGLRRGLLLEDALAHAKRREQGNEACPDENVT